MHPTLNIAVRAARSAGNVIIRNLDRLDSLAIHTKDRNDFVTEVDQQAYALTLTRRSARLEKTSSADSAAHCFSWDAFQNLLLGNYTNANFADCPQRCDRTDLRKLVAVLPSRLFWQSPLELIRL